MFKRFPKLTSRDPKKIEKVNIHIPNAIHDSPFACITLHKLHHEIQSMQHETACVAITYRPKCLQRKIVSSLHKRPFPRWEMP